MDIASEKFIIQQEQTQPQAAVSEDTMSKMGATTNFLGERMLAPMRMVLQGPYNAIPAPNLLMDGVYSYPWAFEITEVKLSTGLTNGSGGVLEIDIKWRPQNSGSWVSIFSTTPKMNGAAGQLLTVGLGQTVSGLTAAVLSKTTFDAHDQLRFDLLQVPTGTVDSATLEIFGRPR